MISLASGSLAPGFDHPLEMLHACHGKILRQCETLEKLPSYLAEHGCDEAAQQAAQGILRYFDTAGKFHHQDEELDLFPALHISAGHDKTRVNELIEQLLSEHVAMVSAWDELRVVLLKLADGTNAPLPEALVNRFIGSHTTHIAVEESELLPLAAQLLDSRQLMQLGKRMAGRRGLKQHP